MASFHINSPNTKQQFDDDFEEDLEINSDEEDTLFFPAETYSNRQSQPISNINETNNETTSNQEYATSQLRFLQTQPTKKVHSAWANLTIKKDTQHNTDIQTTNPAFKRTHSAIDKYLKFKKYREEQAQKLDELENVDETHIDMEIFYREEVRRPLAGIHVDLDE